MPASDDPTGLLGRGATATPDDVWTIEDLAAYFKVTRRTIREWRETDPTFPRPLELPGRSVRWFRGDVVDWVATLRGEVAS